MFIERMREFIKHLNWLSISIPIGVLASSVIFPLSPFARQAMIGVLLIWFSIEAMLGFTFWK